MLRKFALLLLAGIFAAVPSAFAGQRRHAQSPDAAVDPAKVDEMLQLKQTLHLTDEQAETISQIREDLQKDLAKLGADLKVSGIELGGIMKEKAPDFSEARDKAKELSELELQIRTAVIDALEQSYDTLTDEQKKRISQIFGEEHRQRN